MVVPITENNVTRVNLSETKKFVGNNLQLRFPKNTCTMIVVGNNCSLKLSENFGVVKVVGNNCVVQILECKGSVEYTGNNGKITFSCDVKPDAVTYTGQNGRIQAQNLQLVTKKSEKSNSKGCVYTTTKSSSKRKESSLENLDNFIRTHISDRVIFVEDNVKILNPCIKIATNDFNMLLRTGLMAN